MKLALSILTLLSATSIAFAQQFPVELEPLGSGVNSADNDYAPFVTRSQDTLYFTSSRGGRSEGKADIFATTRTNDAWTMATNAVSINTDKNDGSISIAADGRTIVFASDAYDGFGDADLFTADLVDGQVVNIRNMGENVNTRRWESQPAISGDGTTVYFTSNRRGGIGGTDLWMSSRDESGEWQIPVNIGPSVNTSDDELSPFVTLDGGTLFFSSNGRGGHGEQDVFMCAKTPEGSYSAPLNLGATVNSPADDVFFSAPAASERFYLASTRTGGAGALDIYAGSPNVFGGGMFRMRIVVTDSTTGEHLPGTIAVVVEEPDGSFATLVSTFEDDGEHVIYLPAGRRYQVSAQSKGFLMKSALVDAPAANKEQRVDLLCGGQTLATFDLGEYNVPFFVTGYYRPNTTVNLDELNRSIDKELRGATYIERFGRGSARHRQYAKYAERVEAIFAAVTGPTTHDLFATVASNGSSSDVIEITVTGYADP
ncbi:MAG: PD40 domain-containing protein, partial [bacterium]|nr:PD40 domain-containing protein [Candidatus Kapabacteria bacterium]